MGSTSPKPNARFAGLGVIITGLAVAALLAGCTAKHVSGTGALNRTAATASPPATPTGGPTTSGTSTPSQTATPVAGYPSNYALAVLTAWRVRDTARLTQLTSSHDANYLLNTLGSTDQHWTHIRDDGAMGSTYATYYNTNGDSITIQLGNEALSAKQYHAAMIQNFDKMVYPTDASKYVHAFVDAWIFGNKQRMTLLSSAAITSHFLGLTLPDATYQVSMVPGGGAAGHVQFEIKESSVGLDQKVLVTDPLLGTPHAIENCYPTSCN
jgi:hypothetical protein